jgi:hypothetical protein
MDLTRSLSAALRERIDRFNLRDAEAKVAARSAEQIASVARFHRAAQRRLDIAAGLDPDQTAGAMPLYREAAMLLIAARLRETDPTSAVPGSAAEAWRELDALGSASAGGAEPGASGAGAAADASKPPRYDEARKVLASDDPLVVEDLSREELASLRVAVSETLEWLGKGVEPRTVSQIRRARIVRQAIASVAGAVVLYSIGASLFAPKNLALGKRVTASSIRPGTPAVSGLVNGTYEPTYGVHTEVQRNPWVMVDLGDVVSIKRVKVYNRGDGWQNEMVPMTLELSDDLTTWTAVEHRTEVFTRTSPWVAEVGGKRARYVRVALHREGYIALTELEVY